MAVSASPTRRTSTAVAAATIGVYALLLAGATTTITEAAAACTTWPTCQGGLLTPFENSRALIAMTHRGLALLVGGLVLTATALAWRDGAGTRVKLALAAVTATYPIQILIGARTATAGGDSLVSGVHLAVGIAMFAAVLFALLWTLEAITPGAEESEAIDRSSPEPPPGTAQATPEAGANHRGLRSVVLAYLRLTKPRLMWLLCLVAAAGMALAAGSSLAPRTVVATLGGGVLAIGASGTFNHVLERDVDRRMRRTADRPLATDQVGVRNAVAFGVILTVASVATFLTINRLAAVLGLAAIAYYSVIYTLVLKPNTVRNTVIGGLAGSFPAVIGAAAATNTVGLPALALAAVIFLWTPAHFYNLALAYREDYERGGFPMLPVVRGARAARRHVLLYLGATFVGSALLAAAADLGWLYATTAVVVGGVFLGAVVASFHVPSRARTLRSFHASNAYLGTVLVAIIVDALVL